MGGVEWPCCLDRPRLGVGTWPAKPPGAPHGTTATANPGAREGQGGGKGHILLLCDYGTLNA